MPVPGSPGRVPYVHGQSRMNSGTPSGLTPEQHGGIPDLMYRQLGNAGGQQRAGRGVTIEGEETSIRIQGPGGVDYRQGQVIAPGTTSLEYTVRINLREWDTRRTSDEYRTFRVQMPVRSTASQVAEQIEAMAAAIARRNQWSSSMCGLTNP